MGVGHTVLQSPQAWGSLLMSTQRCAQFMGALAGH